MGKIDKPPDMALYLISYLIGSYIYNIYNIISVIINAIGPVQPLLSTYMRDWKYLNMTKQ